MPKLTDEDRQILLDLQLTQAKALRIRRGDICKICTKVISMMAFRGSGFCSELCRKEWHNELDEPMAVTHL